MLCEQSFPGFSFVYKDTGLLDELESNADDLFEGVGSVTGGGVITAVFDSFEKRFNWLVDVKRGAEDSVVFL